MGKFGGWYGLHVCDYVIGTMVGDSIALISKGWVARLKEQALFTLIISPIAWFATEVRTIRTSLRWKAR